MPILTHIKNCTLVIIDCYSYGRAAASLKHSMSQATFDKVLFLTDIPIEIEDVEVINIPSIKNKDEYSQFVAKELYKYITTDFVLITQQDAWIINGDSFDEGLYNYDYAGALWLENDGLANGNGGFSWRSRRLLEAVAKDDFIIATTPEDVSICRVYRRYLEATYDLKWATDEICEQFSFELRQPVCKTFGFHSFFHRPYIPVVVLHRSGALGDIVLMEPVMRYYAMKGDQVVLDIPKHFFDLFAQHYFYIKHISEFDRPRIKPEIEIDLDMSYESKPYQNYLKSYFEFCGITDYNLSKPVLHPNVDGSTKLFKKYAVIHIDKRETEYRNIYGIDWGKVRGHLEASGYTVIQIGANEHEVVGLEINTPSVGLMKFVISGADLFIGVDSAPSHIAVAYNKPSVIFFGSVNPHCIHADLTNIEAIQGDCENRWCWHKGTTAGVGCKFEGTTKHIQCCKVSTWTVVDAINRLIWN